MPDWVRVATTSGTVREFVRGDMTRWRAIPYAQPPMGALRFRAPRPPSSWRGVRYCEEFAYCAPQDPRYTFVGTTGRQPTSEDCLTLNVVAPHEPDDGPLPVMFFIHGGGYMFGSSATSVYDGAAIVRRGAVPTLTRGVGSPGRAAPSVGGTQRVMTRSKVAGIEVFRVVERCIVKVWDCGYERGVWS